MRLMSHGTVLHLTHCFRHSLPAFAVVAFLLAATPSLGQLRVVNYNVAQLLGDEEALMDVFAALHACDKPGFAVPVSVFLFQEVETHDVAVIHQLLNASAPPGVLYAQGTYNTTNQNAWGGAQAMFYRAGMLLEVTSEYDTFFTGAGRWTDRWRLRILGYDSPLARFYAYASHLKASDTQADAELRLWGVQQIRNNAHTLGPGQYIIYAGDFNFYHNQEPGYLWWFSPMQHNAAFDPLGTGSWAGAANAIKHTQSPRKMHMVGGLVGGGMDDRFDFQLATSKFQDGNGLSRIAGTYRSFGNDGMKYDLAINDGNNFYYSWDVPRSNALADALHDASDHIPVVVDYQLPARLSATISPTNFGTVIQGAQIPIQYSVTNAVSPAHVVTPLGADVLKFTATGGGGVSGSGSGSVEALSPPATGVLTLNTTTLAPGSVSGTVTFTSTSEAVQFMTPAVRTTSGTVIAPSQPSFSSSRVAQALTIEIDLDPDTGVYEFDAAVHNFGFVSGVQARMDVDAVDGLLPSDHLSFIGPLATNIGSNPAILTFAFDTDQSPLGVHSYGLTVHTSDENLPGATSSELDLTIVIGIGEQATCPADITGDGVVDIFDLLEVLAAWGPCDDPNDCPADLTDDGVVDIFDLLDVLSQWGPCPR